MELGNGEPRKQEPFDGHFVPLLESLIGVLKLFN